MTISEPLKSKIMADLDELTSSIINIVDTFRSMRSPLIESREQVPQATMQLDKIADQTEEAAHLMLDRIEEITQRETQVIDQLKALPEKTNNSLSIDQAPLKLIIEMAQVNLDDVYLVMDALQFQDITSQQIQYAAHMLEEIEEKLKGVIVAVTGEEPSESEKVSKHRERVFDKNAEYQDRRTDQTDIDNLFQRAKK